MSWGEMRSEYLLGERLTIHSAALEMHVLVVESQRLNSEDHLVALGGLASGNVCVY